MKIHNKGDGPKISQRLTGIEAYYFATKLAEISHMNEDGNQPVLNLGIGNPDLPPDSSVQHAIANSILSKDSHGYQSYFGSPLLRKAWAKWYDRHYGILLDPSKEVLPLIGSKEGVMHIHMAFVNSDDQVLVPNPGYPTYATSARIAGGHVVPYDLKEEQEYLPDLDALSKQDLSRVKVMWINYPHMPTGASINQREMDRIKEFAISHGILLCHDNPYGWILNDQLTSVLPKHDQHPYLLELSSLSKMYHMAGHRLGVVAGHKDTLDKILTFKSNMDSGMSLALQKGAIAALELRDQWREQTNAAYASRQHLAINILRHLGCKISGKPSGLFVWGKLPPSMQDDLARVDQILSKARVFITPGSIFGSQGAGYLRISLCSPLTTLEEALSRMIAYTQLEQIL